MAFGQFLLGSLNFMDRVVGSCVRWPLAYHRHVNECHNSAHLLLLSTAKGHSPLDDGGEISKSQGRGWRFDSCL